MRMYASEVPKYEGESVELMGWVHSRRDHGKLIFVDLRDRTGIVQAVLTSKIPGAADLRLEYVVRIRGIVQKRPPAMVNDKVPTGHHEVGVTELSILNASEALPVSVDTVGYEINEESRLTYRYLDLRRPRLQKNIVLRHRFIKELRDYLDREQFLEIETPILTKSTPEGARDFIVPSRLNKGKFYALPQSPQQYKQLLMIAGVEKYFQIARCFRDEDTRGDRQPEFTQLDLEMSFVERDDIIAFIEKVLIHLMQVVTPGKQIQEVPFPRLSYKEAMEKYGSDKPDLLKNKDDSNLLAFCWIVDFPFFEQVKKDAAQPEALAKDWTFTHNPFSAPKPEHMDDLLSGKNIPGILTTQYDVVLNGFEIGGGSIRNNSPEAIEAVFKVMGYEDREIKRNFGHMLEAYRYGAPSHGGIALGLDRIIAILCNEPNIREVIAFPKTGDGRDPMMESPAEVDQGQLDELGLRIGKESKNKK